MQQSQALSNPTPLEQMHAKLARFSAQPSVLIVLALAAVLLPPSFAQEPTPASLGSGADPMDSRRLSQTVEGLKRTEGAMYLYERVEREESWREPNKPQPEHTTVTRVVPAGTGLARIVLSQDGKPIDGDTYRKELEKLVDSLEWAAESGHDQNKAYAKVDKKLRERDDLIDATRTAFIYTFAGRELREGRTLLKFRIDPNPGFKPQNRNAGFLTKVRGYVWIDEATSQLARVEGRIVEDISFGIFLGKIYKGSRFMQERYPEPSGVWLPSFAQYDFDGRKFLSSISIHEKTYYTDYRRVGPPREALPLLRAELSRILHDPSASAGGRP